MRRAAWPTLLIWVIASPAAMGQPESDAVMRGKTIFESQCARCHRQVPAALKDGSLEGLQERLRPGAIERHRYEPLSAEQIRALAAFARGG